REPPLRRRRRSQAPVSSSSSLSLRDHPSELHRLQKNQASPTSARRRCSKQPSYGGGRRLSLVVPAVWVTLGAALLLPTLNLRFQGPSGLSHLERHHRSVVDIGENRQLHNPGTKGAWCLVTLSVLLAARCPGAGALAGAPLAPLVRLRPWCGCAWCWRLVAAALVLALVLAPLVLGHLVLRPACWCWALAGAPGSFLVAGALPLVLVERHQPDLRNVQRRRRPRRGPDSLVAAESGQTSGCPGNRRASELPPDGFTLTMQQRSAGESTGESTRPHSLRLRPWWRRRLATPPARAPTPVACQSAWLPSINTGPARQLVLTIVQRATAPTTARLLLQVGGALKLVAVPGPPGTLPLSAANEQEGILSDDSIELPRVRQKVLKLAVDWVAQHVYILTKPGDILLASDWYSKVAAEEPKKIGDSPGSRDRAEGWQVLFFCKTEIFYRSDLPRGGLQLNWTRVPRASEASAPLSSFRVLPASQAAAADHGGQLKFCAEQQDLSGAASLRSRQSMERRHSQPIIRLLRLPDAGWCGRTARWLTRRVRLRQRSGSIRELECVEPAAAEAGTADGTGAGGFLWYWRRVRSCQTARDLREQQSERQGYLNKE
uniref:CRAL-TRIO domain-containing protein n=1 Tax=Macrostomum lignano TaxID=282301 RepID=A0A1I8FG42_9PLAT